MRTVVVFLFLASGGGMSPGAALGQEPGSCTVRHYRLVALALTPAAINDRGEIAGTSAAHRAATWSAREGLREIPLPEGYSHSESVSLDDRGTVLGIAYDPGFIARRGFRFADGSLTWLEGRESRGRHINSGVVAGESIPPGAECSGPALWTAHEVRALGGCRGTAVSLNAKGEVIGDVYDDQGRYHAFLWTPGDGIRLIGPEAAFSSAVAINSRGHVVVQAHPSVFLYADGNSTRLGLALKTPSLPHAINDCDIVVGSFGPFSDANRAFVWSEKSGFQDLNTLLAGGTAGWKLAAAYDINNRGEIVGKGDRGKTADAGFLLIPVD